MGKTSIEWTEYTWNPIRARRRATGKVGWHCEHMSEACRHCYAGARNRWIGTGLHYKPGHREDIEIFLDEKALLEPLRWRKPGAVFVCSMTDLFADFVRAEWLDRIFSVIHLCSRHTFQLLTKRPEWMAAYIGALCRGDRKIGSHAMELCWERAKTNVIGGVYVLPPAPWPNVHIGTTTEDQATFDARWPHLAATPAAVRYVSYEPALGPLDLSRALNVAVCRTTPWSVETGEPCGPSTARWIPTYNVLTREVVPPELHWVIAGGESGPRARPPHPEWMRTVRDQCLAAGVPFVFKQWGEWQPFQPGDTYDETWEGAGNKVVAIDGRVSTGTQLEHPGPRPDGGPRWCRIRRMGKGKSGRRLDGRIWNEAPVITLTAPAAAEA